VPTLREQGVDLEIDVWWGLFAPTGVPPAVRERLNREVGTILADPEFARFLKTVGATAAPSTSEELRTIIGRDVARWTDTARRAGIQQP